MSNTSSNFTSKGLPVGGYGVNLSEYIACLQLSQEYQKLVVENQNAISQGEWALGTQKDMDPAKRKQVEEVVKAAKQSQPALDKMANFLRSELIRHQTMIQSAADTHDEAIKRQMKTMKEDMLKQQQQNQVKERK